MSDPAGALPAQDAGSRIVIGIACLVFAAVIVWFSSVATLRFSRSETSAVTCSLEVKALGLVPVSRSEVENVLSAAWRPGREPGSRSSTPDFLVLVTDSGPVDLGYFQQKFGRDFPKIDAFLKDVSARELSLSSVARAKEQLRFAAALLAATLLTLGGVLLPATGVRALLRRA